MVVPAVAGYMFFIALSVGGPINGILSTLTGQRIAIAWLLIPRLRSRAMIADILAVEAVMFSLLAGLVGVPMIR